jgi:hypothetical protein
MAKHTPGPWEVTEHGHIIDGNPWYSINKGAIDIAYERWSLNDEPTRRANARLIAAAPELLRLLNQAGLHLDCCKGQDYPLAAEIAAAIAKAEGKQ